MNFFEHNITLTNFFVLFFVFVAVSMYYCVSRKTRVMWIILLILYLSSSTTILPAKIIANYEDKTPVLDSTILDKKVVYYIHVLGAGYSLDPRLPATSQLSTTTLARLIEAIRISKSLPNFKIITSGYSSFGLESQAEVAKRAAVELGIPFENCEILPTPKNTSEEVKAFASKFGTSKKVIVVSDALHLPRALMLYKKAGIEAIGAPTNFQVKQGVNDSNGISFPSMRSINLMNGYLRERLKYWKDNF